jgi:hypothetical protein
MNDGLLYFKTNKNKFFWLVLIILVISNFTIITFFPFPIVLFSFILLFLIFHKYLYARQKLIDFIFLIYIASYFQYGIAQGGLFNFIAFVFIFFYVTKYEKTHLLFNKSKQVNFYILVIIIANFLGYILKNESGIKEVIFGIITFFGFIFVFNFTSNLTFSYRFFSLFINVSLFTMLYSMLISINKYLMIFNSKLPIFGTDTRFGSNNLGGTLGPSPVAGELGVLFLSLLLPFLLLSKESFIQLGIKRSIVYIFLIINIITIVLAASRSTVVLTALSIIIVLIFSILSKYRFGTKLKSNNYIIGIVFFVMTSILLSSLLNLDYIIKRFESVNIEEISSESLTTGQGINRVDAFDVGKQIITRENWIIGYGWGVGQSNRIAWFGDAEFRRQDPHSLYLSLFPIWGWIGAASYIMIIINLAYQILKIVFRTKDIKVFIIGFAFFIFALVFLINEYKITAMGFPHYFMITWIFFGIMYSFVNTYQKDGKN